MSQVVLGDGNGSAARLTARAACDGNVPRHWCQAVSGLMEVWAACCAWPGPGLRAADTVHWDFLQHFGGSQQGRATGPERRMHAQGNERSAPQGASLTSGFEGTPSLLSMKSAISCLMPGAPLLSV